MLEKFDDEVGEGTDANFGGDQRISLKFWKELSWDIRVKTYLTLYAIEVEAKLNSDLSPREVNILRWSALLLHIGCSKKSKTSKVYTYSFLSALFII